MASLIHPAITVTNIKNFIPITLDNESAQYVTWSELFKIHCTAFLVADHLEPRQQFSSSSSAAANKDKEEDPASTQDSWKRLDAIVLQWIYGTISTNLLRTILKKDTTAYDAWIALENLFQDNKSSRALYLQAKLTNT
ncbi:uncharacterized protein LOC143576087 [Bidens hawaiensis]|uniref:uncharacterized protein LOC143576087 n=1 Tax=Bidens hawaiensis TaxID=980011 RepID=UPI0040491FB8